MDNIRRRLRLYLRYKSQQVDKAEIYLRPEWTHAQNYKALYKIFLRLNRCLESRQKVHELYADNDLGHVLAINYVEKQIAEVEKLLLSLNEQLQKSEEGHTEYDTVLNDEFVVEEEETTTQTVRLIREESRKEVDELAQMESIAQDKAFDTMTRIMNFLRDDNEVSENLRQLVEDNITTSTNMHALLLSFIIMIVRAENMAHIPNLNHFLFYHVDISDTAIRDAMLRFQNEQIVSKRNLSHHLQQAYSHSSSNTEVGDRKEFIGFGLRLFDDIFHGAGHFTTLNSILAVVNLTINTIIISHDARLHTCKERDVVCRRMLLDKYSDDVMDEMESAARKLVHRYHGVLLEKIPWSYLIRTQDYISALFFLRRQIMNRENRLIYFICL